MVVSAKLCPTPECGTQLMIESYVTADGVPVVKEVCQTCAFSRPVLIEPDDLDATVEEPHN